MDKTKLAICMKDLEYQARFVNCFMNHYKHQYEVHVFTHLTELKVENPFEYAVIITGEYTTDEMADFVERGEILLALTADEIGDKEDLDSAKMIYTQKYQEVYRIEELLQRILADWGENKSISCKKTQCQRIGVYALSQTEFQIPFTALLARLCGEEEKALVLDLQSYSALADGGEQCKNMGLEDLLSVAITGSYSKGRLLDCIGHESNWDFVYPMKNSQCLLEGTKEIYDSLIGILENELDYKTIFINFGVMFPGQLELMEQCQNIYLLGGREESGNWRENVFLRELEQSGKEALIGRIKRVYLPAVSVTDGEWRTITEKWFWNGFGEKVRQLMKKENSYGEPV